MHFHFSGFLLKQVLSSLVKARAQFTVKCTKLFTNLEAPCCIQCPSLSFSTLGLHITITTHVSHHLPCSLAPMLITSVDWTWTGTINRSEFLNLQSKLMFFNCMCRVHSHHQLYLVFFIFQYLLCNNL